nr:MAG TPA: tail tape measure protein [Caudoviricetes sp.]
MNVFEIFATLSLDTGEYERSLDGAGKRAEKTKETLIAGAKLAGKAIAGVATGISFLTKSSMSQYAEYEQLVGGAQLMFGDAYDTVAANAENAYKNVQMSQNEYLTQVNGFATGLKTALGGNAQAAAELADRIITAEADVVAATGASQESVQNAFNGIMKNNYTMLDNLQLGITPTKEGFESLIDSVNAWNAENGKMTEYTIDNLADCQSALVDYIEMQGLSGYAAGEAADTIQGSVASMKSAWKDLMTAFADENADLENKIDNLVTSAGNVYQNIEPRIIQVVQGIADFANLVVPKIIDTIGANAPMLLEAAVSIVGTLAGALISNLPTLLTAALELVVSLAESIADNTDAFVDGVVQISTAVADALLNNLPALTAAVVEIIMNLAAEIVMHIPEMLEANNEVILAILGALFAALGSFLEVGGAWIDSLNAAIAAKVSEVVTAAQELVSEFISTLAAKFAEIYEQAGVWVEENLITPISDKVEEFVNIGQLVVDKIREGISNAWESLTSWFSGIWDSLFGNLSVNVGVSGGRARGHAGGLDYVPYNGYPAVLHRGEAVLTSREADNWRKGGAGSPAAAQPIVINIESKTELDGATVARKTYKYMLKEADYHGQMLIKA